MKRIIAFSLLLILAIVMIGAYDYATAQTKVGSISGTPWLSSAPLPVSTSGGTSSVILSGGTSSVVVSGGSLTVVTVNGGTAATTSFSISGGTLDKITSISGGTLGSVTITSGTLGSVTLAGAAPTLSVGSGTVSAIAAPAALSSNACTEATLVTSGTGVLCGTGTGTACGVPLPQNAPLRLRVANTNQLYVSGGTVTVGYFWSQ